MIVIQNNTQAGLTIASVVANNGAAAALTKSGAGLLTLSNAANSYSGGTIINAGTLAVSGGDGATNGYLDLSPRH